MTRTVYYSTNNENTSRDSYRISRSVVRHNRVKRLQRRVVVGILGSTMLLLVFGMLLLVLPMFRVQNIHVSGNSRIADESLIEASGVSIGDEILDLKKGEIEERISENEDVEFVSVKTTLGTVTIQIVEKDGTSLASSVEASTH